MGCGAVGDDTGCGVTDPQMTFSHLCAGWPNRHLVHDLTGVVRPSDRIALTGANGTGKSTLLKVLAGELRPMFGAVQLQGWTRSDIAMLPQASAINLLAPVSVFDVALSGLWRRIGALSGPSRAQRDQTMTALERVGLASRADARIATLSGGELQRLLFARLDMQDARILLLDEPLNAVDQPTSEALLARMEAWSTQGRALIAAVHDPAVLGRFTARLDLGTTGWTWHPTATPIAGNDSRDTGKVVLLRPRPEAL
jgi:zinc/manganese transport system ATP-binding protein